MKFKKEFLQNLQYGKNMEATVIEDTLVEHTRWSVRHKCIFKYEDKFYKTYYSVGATECQEEYLYEYDDEEIECQEVKPVEKMAIIYE